MLGHEGYKKAKITRNPCGDVVEGLIYKAAPHLCVTEAEYLDATWYDVLHTESGLAICICYTRDLLFKTVEALAGLAGLEESKPDPGLASEVREILETVIANATPKVRKQIELATGPPMVLEPYYPTRTPGVAVRAADRQLAACITAMTEGDAVAGIDFKELLNKAVETAWWESVMARVNQVLLPGDVPKRAPIRLRDGTLCTWEGFKESFAKLNDYGDRLLAGSQRLLALPPIEDWEDDTCEAFRRYDDKFRELICAAWMEWAICASHFIGSPPERQQQVRDRVGFVGNEERGWHELGMKTFMRHPEILEACKVRRLGRVRTSDRL